MRFLSCASETTRRSIMSDSMNRLGMSRSAMSARRWSASPVDTVRQLLIGWNTIPSPANSSIIVASAWVWKNMLSMAPRTPTSSPSARLSSGLARSYSKPRFEPPEANHRYVEGTNVPPRSMNSPAQRRGGPRGGVAEFVLEAEIRAARGEPQVRRVDERAAVLHEQLGEAPED